VLILAVALLAAPAGAQEPAGITVTPSTGLTNGQTVTVQGHGFRPNTTTFATLTLALCPSDVLTDVSQAPLRCGATLGFANPVDDAGVFVGQLQVFTSQPVFQGTGTLDCLAPLGCVVLAVEVVEAPPMVEIIVATAPVTFGTVTKQDCKKDGWRSLTDNQGRRFKNQGQCIQFVNSGK
jgi:hypothetical protein